MDELIRHAITKMSRLHFAAAEPFARRLIQMGEEPWRVHVTGEPGLDNLRELGRIPTAELETLLGMSLSPAPVLVTYHPATMEYEETAHHMGELLAALEGFGRPVVFTYPNADSGSQAVIGAIHEYVSSHPSSRAVRNLGRRAYCSLMEHVTLMAGNSSSGIVEAASFELPVVNVGNRQKGRLCGKNVIHAPDDRAAILAALHTASATAFAESLRGLQNPYGDGRAAERIVEVLASIPLDRKLRVKKFHDQD
jgi:UDP-hydrolysing UDP-N-acetyl-D-glucosamine 2-epimerase